ncbi:hypothetical protein AFL01nite_14370 [Aeromicrobium flavum]|uniref:Uncharacterized protein n=1 Tax=Aeromicrobium flavum TaxID=416568 RepID=A0A512HUM9_9ACTN|nr:hypothetical protein [Aeromicrobium flavum]GEO89110.1 hypothetical protein AFL01nite_14370 [Aeromicrobium flavum]
MPNVEDQFWAGGDRVMAWSIATVDQSLDPEAYGAYLDSNALFDDCGRKSLAIGIAHPQDAPLIASGVSRSRGYIITMYAQSGVFDQQRFSANYQAVTNDCPFGIAPNTDCMGLDSSGFEDLAGNLKKSEPIVNADRNWTLPGCFWSSVGSDPYRYAPEECIFYN